MPVVVRCCLKLNAGVAELADAIDLGSIGTTVQVQVLSPAPEKGVTSLCAVSPFLLFFRSVIYV